MNGLKAPHSATADCDKSWRTAIKRLRRLPLLLALAFVFAACGGDGKTGASVKPELISVRQSDGRVLELKQTPARIVSLAPHATETICGLGAGETLVAVDKFANCPQGSKTKPEVDSFQPNLEAIAGFRPDLVYVFSDQGGIVTALRNAGVAVLFLKSPDSLAGVYENIEVMGRVLGRRPEATKLVASMKAREQAVTGKLGSVARGPRIFHELSSDYYTLRSDTFIGELYNLLKASNIADGASSAYPQLSAEAIIQRDPEVIVLVSGEKPQAVRQRPGWSAISAVRNNRICEVDGDLVSRPGPRIIDGLEALAKCLYP